jgi:DNA polymerase-3 subunit gamma/tau
MSYQVLARKYRPQKFSEVIGQEHVTRTLRNAIEQQRIAHGYIFSGHRGIGKTTIARILAMALNCRSAEQPVAEPCGECDSCREIREGRAVDVIEIDAATNRGIDEIRELREAARYRPARDRFKIYILDEAHQITDAAFNALLKTLEEPPSHIVFMLATTAPEDIPQTIRSRCQHFSFHAVKFDEIVGQLKEIAGAEKIAADEDALALLAEAGDGSMRDALSIMDQAIACCGARLTAEQVRGLVGAVPSEVLEEMLGAVERNSSEEMLRLVDRLITEGQNPAHFARQMVRFLRNAVVAKVAGRDSSLLQISSDERERMARVAKLFGEEDLARFLNIMLQTHSELGDKLEQRFHLELGLLKLVHAQRLLPLEELLSGAAASGTTASEAVRSTRSFNPPAKSASAQAARRFVEDKTAGEVSGPARPSPFEADRARKARDEMSATATAVAEEVPRIEAAVAGPVTAESIRDRVLGMLEEAEQHFLVSQLEQGEWTLAENEVLARVPMPQATVDLALNGQLTRSIAGAAAAAAGRAIKVRIEGGATSNGGGVPAHATPAGEGARSRAANDPVVRRVQEKFGAEIRSVIDHREKKR